MIIYLDILLLFNLFCNFLILSLTTYLAKVYVTIYRLLIGSIIATLLVPLTMYYPHSIFNTFIGKSMYALLIIFCTFGCTQIHALVKKLLLFYFVSFSIGGGLFGIHYLLQDSLSPQVINAYGDHMSVLIILIGFPLITLFTKIRMDRHVLDKIKYDQLYDVTIEMNGYRYLTTGYIDSGNHLVDPLTNRPVVICDEVFMKQYFTESDWGVLKRCIQENKVTHFPESIEKKIFIVPYQGVGGNSHYLYTIKPDKIMIDYDNRIIETSNVLIGIQLANLTGDNGYHCLLHPQIIYFNATKTA